VDAILVGWWVCRWGGGEPGGAARLFARRRGWDVGEGTRSGGRKWQRPVGVSPKRRRSGNRTDATWRGRHGGRQPRKGVRHSDVGLMGRDGKWPGVVIGDPSETTAVWAVRRERPGDGDLASEGPLRRFHQHRAARTATPGGGRRRRRHWRRRQAGTLDDSSHSGGSLSF
jgi:hypothetical protein